MLALAPDHVLITGDLTTTALSEEFRDAREALADLFIDSTRVTVIPGNHDRYTTGSVRYRQFEEWFGVFSPQFTYPWLHGLTMRRPSSAWTPRARTSRRVATSLRSRSTARELLADSCPRPALIVACHYPVEAPPEYVRELEFKRMKNAEEVATWLACLGPHLSCCGHVHAAWAFVPRSVPEELCLNAGARCYGTRRVDVRQGFWRST